jgi:hypothetical protein
LAARDTNPSLVSASVGPLSEAGILSYLYFTKEVNKIPEVSLENSIAKKYPTESQICVL